MTTACCCAFALTAAPLRALTAAPQRAPAAAMRLAQLFGAPPAAESRLLTLVEGGGTRGQILAAFEELEANSPAPADVLTRQAAVLDGRWTLLGTVAARVGDEEDLDSTGVSNAVNASGIVIDTDAARKPVQQIDVARGRIGNEIRFETPFGRAAIVRVAGSFETDARDGRRANVEFDSLDVFLAAPPETGDGVRRVVSAGWLFDAVRLVRPALIDGRDNAGSWLETTYLNERVRLGRGNKGSIFVLQRASGEEGDAPPLAAWPL